VLAIEPAEVRARFQREIGQATTKVGADGVVFDDDGRVLLVKRADDGRWGLVAGWVEPGEHPRDTIAREFAEELGVEGRARELVDVFARPASAEYGPHGIIAVVYLCDVASRDFRMQPHEVVDAGWHHLDDVDAWHMNHETYARAAYDAWRRRDGR
jgi:ADP-ribose pyrophosphatase YjhB (NUDIX family)